MESAKHGVKIRHFDLNFLLYSKVTFRNGRHVTNLKSVLTVKMRSICFQGLVDIENILV